MSRRWFSTSRGRSGSRDSQRSDGSSERTFAPDVPPELNSRHAVVLASRRLQQQAALAAATRQQQPGPSAARQQRPGPSATSGPSPTPTPESRPGFPPPPPTLFARPDAPDVRMPQRPSAPLPSSSFPRPSGLFHAPDVRMLPEMQRPRTPVTATSSAGGSTVPSDPPPDLFFPPLVPAIPETTPEGVPLPIPEDRPRFILVEQAYVYRPFEGMTLPSARVCGHDKEASTSATSAAAGNKNNV